MNKLMMGAVLAVCCSASTIVQADPQASTSWFFRATYQTGQYSESRDPTVKGSILMYTGANWQCEREAVSLNKRGFLVAGYSCVSPSGFVSVIAMCSPTEQDSGYAQAGIGDGSGNVTLTASCVTKAAPAAPAKAPVRSTDKNL